MSSWSARNVWNPLKATYPPTLTEREALSQFLGVLKGAKGSTVAGWNIGYEIAPQVLGETRTRGFDIPMLLTRAEKYGLEKQYQEAFGSLKIRDIGHETSVRLAGIIGQEKYKPLVEPKLWEQARSYYQNAAEVRKSGASVAAQARFLATEGYKFSGWKQSTIYEILTGQAPVGAHLSSVDIQTTREIAGFNWNLSSEAETALVKRWGRLSLRDKLLSQAKAGRPLENLVLQASESGITTEFSTGLRNLLQEYGLKTLPPGGIKETYSTVRDWSLLEKTGKFLRKNKFKAGMGAGALLSIPLIINSFSGRDDNFNVIEGLRHDGIAGGLRQRNTDFGSGWIGLLKSWSLNIGLSLSLLSGGVLPSAPAISQASRIAQVTSYTTHLKVGADWLNLVGDPEFYWQDKGSSVALEKLGVETRVVSSWPEAIRTVQESGRRNIFFSGHGVGGTGFGIYNPATGKYEIASAAWIGKHLPEQQGYKIVMESCNARSSLRTNRGLRVAEVTKSAKSLGYPINALYDVKGFKSTNVFVETKLGLSQSLTAGINLPRKTTIPFSGQQGIEPILLETIAGKAELTNVPTKRWIQRGGPSWGRWTGWETSRETLSEQSLRSLEQTYEELLARQHPRLAKFISGRTTITFSVLDSNNPIGAPNRAGLDSPLASRVPGIIEERRTGATVLRQNVVKKRLSRVYRPPEIRSGFSSWAPRPAINTFAAEAASNASVVSKRTVEAIAKSGAGVTPAKAITGAGERAIVSQGVRIPWKGVLAGGITLGGIALLVNAFSGKDDSYNTIEGFQHRGLAGRQRRQMTGFGSGFIEVPKILGEVFAKSYGKRAAGAQIARTELTGFWGAFRSQAEKAVLGLPQTERKAFTSAFEKMREEITAAHASKLQGIGFVSELGVQQQAKVLGVPFEQVMAGTRAHESFHMAVSELGLRETIRTQAQATEKVGEWLLGAGKGYAGNPYAFEEYLAAAIESRYYSGSTTSLTQLVRAEKGLTSLTERLAPLKSGQKIAERLPVHTIEDLTTKREILKQQYSEALGIRLKSQPPPLPKKSGPPPLPKQVQRQQKWQQAHSDGVQQAWQHGVRPGTRHTKQTGKIPGS